ncbi:MAG: ATP-binding protein [Christensenellales bacterium]|jgi:signal transduction histidine kinase
MKLRTRQTLIPLAIILVVMGAFLYAYTGLQADRLLADARRNGAWQLDAFAEHITALERTAALEAEAAHITRQALVQYTFATYAHLLQNADRAYSLWADGAYLYNLSPIDPAAQLPIPDKVITASRMLHHGGELMLISACSLRVLDVPVTLYLTENISRVEEQINNLVRIAQVALVCSLVFCALVLPPLVRKSLSPLETLSGVADKIAGGAYALRAGINTADEVGDLSRAFDRMAATVEDKISTLEETNRRQEMLLGALTHELKTPMTAIIGFADSVLTMPLTDAERADALQEIHEAARRTERLSQKMMQLIALGHEQGITKKRINTADLLKQAARAAGPAAQAAGVHIAQDVQVSALRGDPDLLHSALTNLIDNAIKASQPGQRITLRARRAGGDAVLSVIDEGRGIPAADIPRLTEPFYRVDKARSRKLGGAGLGLALCRMIAQAHGGRLQLDSKEGRGTAMHLVLPGEDTHAP